MKNLIYIFILAALVACGDSGADRQRFMDAYHDVLLIRELETDSLRAARKVDSALRSHGFTEPEFRSKYFEMAEDRDQFIKMVDSLRLRARREAEEMRKPADSMPQPRKIITNPKGKNE
ncbi:MAG: hypothetical protein ACLFQX_10640 [Candidatus Kapaibacterium sp.]